MAWAVWRPPGLIHRVLAMVSILYFVLEVGYVFWYVHRAQGP